MTSLDDANVKVIEVVVDRLAYYYDHRATPDAEIARQEQTARQLQKEAGDSDALVVGSLHGEPGSPSLI